MSPFTNFWIFLLFNVILLVTNAKGAARFTVVPPSVLYVSSGGTARFVWDYSVDNRFDEFNVFSPRWLFFDENNKDFLIGHENVFNRRKWILNTATCPARLFNPTRVSKESNATLVIHNVTMADSGTYGCRLELAAGNPMTSKVKLVVTSKPHFTSNPIIPETCIDEYQDLSISCSAKGLPKPNITWAKVLGVDMVIKRQGVENLKLTILNITRHDSGIYKCCATNNPNEEPICRKTTVIVMYKPEINHLNSSSAILSFNGKTISLSCLADGQPPPVITWYNPYGRQMTSGIRSISGGSILELNTVEKGQCGLFKCIATNVVGYDEDVISVTETVTTPTKPRQHLNQITPTLNRDSTTPSELLNRVSTKLNLYSCKKVNVNIVLAVLSGVVVSILITISIFLVIKLRRRYKRNEVENNGKETQRFVCPTQAPVGEDVISLSPIEPVLTVETTPHVKEQKEDYERISDKSVSPSSTENTAQEDNEIEIHLTETQHQYQELNDANFILNKQVYQSLDRTGDVAAQVEPTALAEQNYEPLKFPDKPQSSEYQKLHL